MVQNPTFQLLGSYEAALPRDPKVVPFGGSYIESYKVTPKRNYFGASGYSESLSFSVLGFRGSKLKRFRALSL